MRYFLLMGLCLVVSGCINDPWDPDDHRKPRTQDVIAVGVEEADGGEVWVLCQYVDRWKEGADPIHLDSQPVPDFQYQFYSMTRKLRPNGQWYQGVYHDNSSSGLVYHYGKVTDGYLIAGVNFGYCGVHNSVPHSLPLISVRDENYQSMRWAQLPCEYGYALSQNWEEMQIYPLRVLRLANGNLLFNGYSPWGTARLSCVTEYGEVLWSQENGSQTVHSFSLTSLRNGGYAFTDQQNEVVMLYDDNGVHGRDFVFSTTDEYRVKTVVQLANGEYVVGGVNQVSNDPHLWRFRADGTEIGDTALVMEDCQDSVALFNVGENILLAGMNGTQCSGTGAVRLLLLDSTFTAIGEESFGGAAHTVLKDVTVTGDGSILLCGAFDRGIGSYSTLVTKFDASLHAVWSTVMHP